MKGYTPPSRKMTLRNLTIVRKLSASGFETVLKKFFAEKTGVSILYCSEINASLSWLINKTT